MALWRKLGNGVASASAFKQQRISASDASDAPLIENETNDQVKETEDPVKEAKDPETKDPVPQILTVEETFSTKI